ncbi:MAG: hypothetical protein IPL77_09420 [Flavobacteriales bacterium]|nr:hypothetical protein [Flavobacteriales bacterium]
MFKRWLQGLPFSARHEHLERCFHDRFQSKKVYVVQTSLKAIQRCILMTTDPGDLVLDPTCGSGTTATIAEQWGRHDHSSTPAASRSISPRRA